MRLGGEGADFVVTGNEVGISEAVVSGIQSYGGTATFVRVDLGHIEDIRALAEESVNAHGPIDVVVNNAAIQSEPTVRVAKTDQWQEVFNFNYRAYWLLIRILLDHLSSGASIVNISSNPAHHTNPGEFPYNAIKAGVQGMTRAMALDRAPLGVWVNSVASDWILLERTKRALFEEDLWYLGLSIRSGDSVGPRMLQP